MPIVHNRPMQVQTTINKQPTGENGSPVVLHSSPPATMIRVDYQRKKTESPNQPPDLVDPGSSSPVSSIQEEFYNYLGISSKSSGDSDAEPSTTTPSKSPLDEFDLSKRRSLRVRVVNKLKEHQAKLQKMAEVNTTAPSSPPDSINAVENGQNGEQHDEDALLRSNRLCSGDSAASSTTILARRCYTIAPPPPPSPSPSVRLLMSTTSPLFLSPRPSSGGGVSLLSPYASSQDGQSQPPDDEENFSDFEDEIKKHVQLSSRLPLPSAAAVVVEEEEITTVAPIVDSQEQQQEEEKKKKEEEVKAKPKPSRLKKKQIITHKRIVIRRRGNFTPSSTARKRFNSTSSSSSKWPTTSSLESKKRRMKVSNNNNNNNNNEVEINSSAVIPSKFPQFKILLKAEDVRPYTVLDADVQRKAQPGPILGTFYCDQERVLLVVTEKRVVFYQRHTNVVLFQKVAAMGVGGQQQQQKPRNSWSKLDETPRLTRDDLVGKFLFEQQITRVKIAGGDGNEKPTLVYVEMRAQPLKKDLEYRTSAMSAVYLNVYYLSRETTTGDGSADRVIQVKTICLDTIVASSKDISYVILPHERSIVVCWNERHVMKNRLGICKYNLSADFETLASVEEFQAIEGGELTGLRWGAPNFVIGTGNQQISIWDHKTGGLLSNIHLKDFELGDTLYAQVMNVERMERHLLLVQYWQNYLNVMHVNLLDFKYRVLSSRELSCTKEAVQSVVRLEGGDGANVILGLVARGGGGEGHEKLQLFDALSNRLVVMQRNGVEVEGDVTRLFLNERYLVKLNDLLDPERISIQAVNEFLFNLV